MKRKLRLIIPVFLSLFLLLSFSSQGQTVITQWNFDDETLEPSTGLGTATNIGGTTFTWATGVTGRGWNTSTYPAQGEGSGTAGVEFMVSTEGYKNIKLNFQHRASGTASRWAQIQYTTDGGTTWEVLGNNNGGLSPHDKFYPFEFDFSAIPAVNDNPDFGVRIVSIFSPVAFNQNATLSYEANEAYMRANAEATYPPEPGTGTGNYGASGTWRFDDVTFSGKALPAPPVPVDFLTIMNKTGTNIPVQVSAAPGVARAAALYKGRYVIVPSRATAPDVWAWDSQNPTADPVKLPAPAGGYTGGLFAVNYVRTVGDNIYVSNMTTDASNPANPLKVYRWNALDASPELILSVTGDFGRLGDVFSIIGDPATQGHIMVHRNTSKTFYLWEFQNGALVGAADQPTEVVLDVPEAHINTHGIFNPIPGEESLFIVSSNIRGMILANLQGEVLAELNTSIVQQRSYDPNIFYFNGNRYLTFTLNSESGGLGSRLQIYDISMGETVLEAFSYITNSNEFNARLVFDLHYGPNSTALNATNQVVVDESGNTLVLSHVVDRGFVLGQLAEVKLARAQIIHNSADPAAANVDVFVNGTLAIPDFAFRTATKFIELPAEVELTIDIAPAGAGIAESVGEFKVTLDKDQTYVIVANGLIPADKDPVSTEFNLFKFAPAREEAEVATNTDILVFHGSTDAPEVSVWAMGGENELFTFSYGQFSGYLPVATTDLVLEVRTADGSQVVAAYQAPLATLELEGEAITVLASGFLTPEEGQAAFGLYVAKAAGGALLALPVYEPPTYTVTFDIKDAAGNPIDDAEITLGEVTNPAGNYTFGGLVPGIYAYTVTKAGYVDATGQVTVVDADITETVTLTLKTYTVTFDVKDESGNPINDAVVTLGGVTNAAGNYVFTDIAPGTYAYTVVRTGFFSKSGDVVVTDQDLTVNIVMQVDNTGIADQGLDKIRVFPVPASTNLKITSPEQIRDLRIIDMVGQVVYAANVSGFEHQINVSGLKNGIYFVRILTDRGIETRRIQVQK